MTEDMTCEFYLYKIKNYADYYNYGDSGIVWSYSKGVKISTNIPLSRTNNKIIESTHPTSSSAFTIFSSK